MKNNKGLFIPSALTGILVLSLIGYGEAKNKIKTNAERIEELKEGMKDAGGYIMEQQKINTEQKVTLDYIKQMLQKIDRKLEE